MNNPYQKYVNSSISTMTPMQAVIALYAKAEQEIQKAIYYIDNKQIPNANASIVKVQDIILGLQSVLQKGLEISENLNDMYDFFLRELMRANISKDTEILKSLLPFIRELKDAFTQISKK